MVISDAGTLAPEIKDEIGEYSDIVGSRSYVNAPIVAGIWDLFDRKAPTESYTAEWVRNEISRTGVITESITNQSYELKPGSLLWIPKGSRASLTRPEGLSAIYVEQRHGEGNFKTGSEANASCDLCSKLATLINNFVAENPSSLAIHKRAQETLAGENTRSVLHGDPFTLYMEGGQGPYLYSVDKGEYRDFVSDYSAAFYGHSNPAIAEAISSALSTGFSSGSATRKECHLGECIKRRFPSMERVSFCNSGTEANTYALATAMEFTGRTKVDLAVNIVEPMLSTGGQILATREFLSFLRKTADVTGAMLIFYEITTSRLQIIGLQGLHKIKPGMTTLGKYIGGGLPFVAFGERSDIMALHEQRTQKLSHYGTFNNDVFTMSAALAATDLVTEDEIRRVNKLGDTIRNRMTEICATHHYSGLEITGLGSAIGLQFLRLDRNLLMRILFYHRLQHGIESAAEVFFF
ncbi:glutamate-1-semialdehyde 2 1-aminomutase [Fusarium mundagurra]|uniref:Glutamate-1-semialdehyde 2 1-aminomutase n=1 Tax=Fusarium mundagurra TaxID=1567541 RepID=A0A8H5YJH2_9HYPO|nr:glutamate-1-semialdehyde 2 1-aminomutase [Fusarium mundagurra]